MITSTTPVDRVGARDVGGKAWNLFRLRELGFAVPDWRVVPSRVFDDALEPCRHAIEGVLRGIDFADGAAVDVAAAQIRAAILGTSLPACVRRDLSWALGAAGNRAAFAVRSSVVGEDSEKNSFAGLMDSFVNVPADEVPRRIREVWASVFSARALLYRHRKEIPLADVSAAVIVQDMVPATVSGVLFTRDPENRKTTCVIAAAHGLGDGVTSGLAEADTYRIGWDCADISAEVSEKTARVIRSAAGGTRIETLAPALARARVLTDAQIVSLRDAGRELEARLGAPQDVEWAFDGAGRLWLLQARPIVFPERSHRMRIWDNSNIVESFPGLTLPLTFSFARQAYEATFRNFARQFVPSRRSLAERRGVFKSLLGLIDGRVYYNLLNWYEMIACMPGFDRRKASWDEMIGIAQRTDYRPPAPAAVDRLRALAVMAWKLLTVRRTATRFLRAFDPVYRRHAALDLSAACEEDLLSMYEAIRHDLGRHWHLTIDNDYCVITYYGLLRRLYRRWAPSASANAENELLRGQSGIESIAPVRSLDRLAGLFRDQPALAEERDASAILERIRREPALAPLGAALERHLQEFGDRSFEELKLENSTFRERPDLLIELVMQRARGDDPDDGDAAPGRTRPVDPNHPFLRRVRNPLKRLVLRFVLDRTRLAVANRENMRFARCRLFGLARRIFARMGKLFAEQGVLAAPSDIHYLTVDEVFDFVRGASVNRDLKALVELRKTEYRAHAKRTPADRIVTSGIPYLGDIDETQAAGPSTRRAIGIGCASGVARGNAKVILDPRAAGDVDGRIIVARSTDPGWVFLMSRSRGLVVEKGSVLSHTAIIGRELGIPTVVGVSRATHRIPDGAEVTIDGSTGEVRWH